MEIRDAAEACKKLYAELEDYAKKGVSIMMDGSKASPMQIVAAHLIREEGTYMRDYVADEGGRIKTLMFVNVNVNEK